MHALRAAHEGVMRASACRSQTSQICRCHQTTGPLHAETCNGLMCSREALQDMVQCNGLLTPSTTLTVQRQASCCKRLQTAPDARPRSQLLRRIEASTRMGLRL